MSLTTDIILEISMSVFGQQCESGVFFWDIFLNFQSNLQPWNSLLFPFQVGTSLRVFRSYQDQLVALFRLREVNSLINKLRQCGMQMLSVSTPVLDLHHTNSLLYR